MKNDEFSVAARARIHAALGDPARLAIIDSLSLGDAAPGELGAALGMATNLVAHHLKALQDAGLILRTRSEGDRRRTYVRLIPQALTAIVSPLLLAVPARVVFVCTHNSARSQIAAAFWARRSHIPAASAGTQPADRVHPRAVRVARRHGLHLDPGRTTQVRNVVHDDDLVIAVCDVAHEQLPAQSRPRLHWSVPDPAPADTDEAFEAAFADITARIERLTTVLPGDDHDPQRHSQLP